MRITSGLAFREWWAIQWRRRHRGSELAVGEDTAALTAALPLGEVTPPEEVAEVIAFLASGKARHTTGATIDITGADYVR